ncbi:hypothetical protein HMPREF0971_02972 [Segatella oris F0302]|uniref:Uncharacterized protein n=1 Tax=Segatella oris F0302 TaxID=649760 RepID=D1QVJ4_9BACT|nr:hypothetical protein HMPREF0971_02972 [Segatella oris F0302]
MNAKPFFGFDILAFIFLPYHSIRFVHQRMPKITAFSYVLPGMCSFLFRFYLIILGIEAV